MFNSIDSTCEYYTEEQFKDSVGLEKTFSLIHFNCRSLYANFSKINDYVKALNSKLRVIALSETWIDKSRGIDFCIDGYELYYSSRKNKRGGGVALFIDSDFKCKLVESVTLQINDLFECVTIEIDMEKKKNVIVTCVYRTPGSKVEVFNDRLEELLIR